MAIIDCVSWQPNSSRVVYAHKYPENNLSTATQLIVNESQEALLFSKGQLIGKFGPGKHTLSSENLPILRSLYGLPFGGKNPFMAEVWFINKVQTFNIEWCAAPISIHDADYQTMLPLAASGQYGLQIVDSEKFVIKVVGTRTDFTEQDMTSQFTGEFNTKVKSAVVKFMSQQHVGFKQVSAYLDDLSNVLHTSLEAFWNDLGLQLTKFYVSDIDIDTSTDEGRRVKDALARQSAQSITGHSWQQEQMFNTANNAIGGIGGAGGTGGLLGGLVALNMMNGMGGAGASGMMQPQYQQPTFGPNGGSQNQQGTAAPQQAVRMVYCSNCAKRFPSNMTFCPNCGSKYNPCPNCGTDNPDAARRCVSCGTPLSPSVRCESCGQEVPQGMAFCPNCGHPTAAADSSVCSRCGAQFPPGARFCPRCGNPK